MTSMSLMPGIQRITIRSGKEHENSSIARLEKDGVTEIVLDFTLNGLKKLINPITLERDSLYIYSTI
ncbi:hypothetical protein H4683_003191 [Filibacter limicola]|uniref:Uncharacterized protein n=1 Tax=Sporosarcina limicola TaxID=34101 RepID=A0A927MJX1_9BACL|nr:hypothetical protein [Sporosarcina limicola]